MSFTPRLLPGPSVLYGALQRLQYSQSGFFLRAITDFQISQDNSLQPLQVPHYQDAKSADTKKHTLRRDIQIKAKASPCRLLLSPPHEGRQGPGVHPPQRKAMLCLHVGQDQLQHLIAGGGRSGLLLLPLGSLQDRQQVQKAQQYCLVQCETENQGNPADVLSKTPVTSKPPDHPQLLQFT